MTPEQRAEEIVQRYGMPDTEDKLRAMLELAHQQGKVDGGEEMRSAMRKALNKESAVNGAGQ
jgi:hypothetical protein